MANINTLGNSLLSGIVVRGAVSMLQMCKSALLENSIGVEFMQRWIFLSASSFIFFIE